MSFYWCILPFVHTRHLESCKSASIIISIISWWMASQIHGMGGIFSSSPPLKQDEECVFGLVLYTINQINGFVFISLHAKFRTLQICGCSGELKFKPKFWTFWALGSMNKENNFLRLKCVMVFHHTSYTH